MSDFNSSLPVRTENPGDVVVFLSDPTTPSQKASVNSNGSQSTLIRDASGNAVTSQANGSQRALDVGINVAGVQIDPRSIRALTSADVVTANQGAAAATHAGYWWTRMTDGTNDVGILATGEIKVAVTQALPTGANTIGAVNQGTNPWITSDLADGSATGGTAGTKSLLAGVIYNTALPTLTNGQQVGAQADSSGRLLIGSIASPLPAGTNVIGSVNQGTSPWVTSDLADGSATGGTAGTKSMLAGGIFNSALPTLTNGQQSAIQFDSSARVIIAPLTNSSVVKSQLQDNAGNGLTSSAAGGTRPLDVSQRDASGNLYTLLNPFPVVVSQNIPGTNINKYNTTVNVAAAGTTNHDYAVTVSKVFTVKKFWVAASGKVRIDAQTSPDGTTFTTYWTGFNSTANPNIPIDLDLLSITDTGAGAKVRIVITNLDKAAFDVYSTISGVEN